jgi:hypothetical protein
VAAPAQHCLPSVRLGRRRLGSRNLIAASKPKFRRRAMGGWLRRAALPDVCVKFSTLPPWPPWPTVFLAVQHGEFVGTGKFKLWALRCEVGHAEPQSLFGGVTEQRITHAQLDRLLLIWRGKNFFWKRSRGAGFAGKRFSPNRSIVLVEKNFQKFWKIRNLSGTDAATVQWASSAMRQTRDSPKALAPNLATGQPSVWTANSGRHGNVL